MRTDFEMFSGAGNTVVGGMVGQAIDVLIYEGEWSALAVLSKHFGGDVLDYVCAHDDCPWK
jgi:hypothetical protein